MKPCSNRDWQAYIGQQLAPHSVYEEYEMHLYMCDECLRLFMETVEASEQQPAANANKQVIDQMMSVVQSGQLISPKRKPVPFIRRALFQYGVAAIITLLLMSAGVFQGLSISISQIETRTSENQKESFSEKLMEKTVAILDMVESQPQGGGKP
jgi:predicted anti-sigma-YlaC factor YlaD